MTNIIKEVDDYNLAVDEYHGKLMADAISRVYENKSVSTLFD